MQAIILDTETHTLNGQPIEIAYAPIQIEDGKISLDKSQIFDQLYQVDEPISFAAMAVHHILESDLELPAAFLQSVQESVHQLLMPLDQYWHAQRSQ